MKWLLRGAALILLMLMAAGYLLMSGLAITGDAIGWVMNATDRALERLSAWGEAL